MEAAEPKQTYWDVLAVGSSDPVVAVAIGMNWQA